ncbi:MAG: 2-octaprenyl-6-methoxyphenol hydroxylase [Rhodocyclaceae bacterium]|nr:MAG: 2-octaprenyl-6-methoxyphenol hydroxylase [Rhodocyclaceae bacterium]TND01210.1 MAG: 2-octaprenyl-6-methoxyphenol hydroxylase [Rhodocyclaceae bacterium]
MALALALKLHGVKTEIFEARERAAVRRDPRVLALSDGARQILDWLGVWSGLCATPIETIHISQRGGFGRTLLRAADLDLNALGWVLPASDLIAALDAAVSAAGIVYREGTKVGAAPPCVPGTPLCLPPKGNPRQTESGQVTARFSLTAFAEGMVEPGAGTLRDYGQHAVLCNVSVAAPHRNVAWERFTDEGPVALLPLGRDYSVVLTCADRILDEVKSLDDAAFLAVLQQRFGTRHRFTAATPRVAYPLGLRYRPDPVGERQVWLGNAAQTLHPVAGQGFNLALRDIWELAQQVGAAEDPGAPEVLADYAQGRQADRRGAIGFTDLLIDGFASDFAPLKHARGAGLLALDLLPPLRAFVAKRMIYGARAWP